MNNLQPLVWHEQQGRCFAKSPITEYETVSSGDKYKVYYTKRRDNYTREATGFLTVNDAKAWAWNHYNEKMQPYVKPMPTWIDASERLPEEDGLYLALRKGFTFEMGNASDLVPQVSGWNGGRGCFADDHGNVLITHWMPIPEFSTMQNLHKGGDCG